ncbi:MAG: hypothetical protein ISR75_00355 [Phycisphaerales bacterium]|nr:hypothetical protein [Phycisphaerales bacterium]
MQSQTNLFFALVTVFSGTVLAYSQQPPNASIAPSQQDLNGDALLDDIVADPYWNENRGKVTISSSMHPESTIELTGVSPGDYPELFTPFGVSYISCRDVGPFQHEVSVPRSIVYLGCYNCADSSEEICRILAHELLHAVQQCKLGWLTKPCKEALKLSNTFHANPKNAFCLEFDVNSQLSQIDCASMSGESDCHTVCASLSNNHGDWLDFDDCETFCEFCGDCCQGHLWQPSEGNCPEDPCHSTSPTTDVEPPE